MPLSDDQVADIAAFLHARAAEGLASSEVPEAYSVARLLTGNAERGENLFRRGRRVQWVSFDNGRHGWDRDQILGDRSGVAYVYPDGHHSSVVVTLPSGEKIEGPLEHIDDFEVALRDASGWYRSFARDR